MSTTARASLEAIKTAAMASGGKRDYTPQQWNDKLDSVRVSKSNLNALVMNYLIIEGYQSAATKFAQEANITANVALDSIEDRMKIRAAIHAGDIQDAIERINDLDPELLDTNPVLHFSLLRLQLIELIRKSTSSGDIQPALSFATTHLASRAARNPDFLADLERTMALLCFPVDQLVPQLAELLDPALHRRVAADVNEAILEAQGVMREAKLRGLVRLWGWAENSLRQDKVDFPALDLRRIA
ncbi:CTLH/CRA C-terminal to lish motif domain-containing protein [Limtongia smithiae]|uniref:CTLH/CRA C-terminal to lish motif domain-containing protein n=1 Tax=Limtongia smithiae TaxID=1125753 RepID=UPI0034CD9366